MTTNEYPKTCTRQEAIDCVKAGGSASAKGRNEERDNCWRNLVTVRGEVTHPSYSRVDPFYPFLFDDRCWNYRIDAPAPVAQPETYSTAEAIVELYKHKPGGAEFIGRRADDTLTLSIDEECDLFVESEFGDLLDFIPNIRWARKVSKPAPLSLEVTVGPEWIGDTPVRIGDDFRRMRRQWKGKIRVTYTVEAVDQ